MKLFAKDTSSSEKNDLIKQVSELTAKNNILHKKNIGLQKKIDILEEAIVYYKNLNSDSQKIIKQASKDLQKLSSEKTDLIKQASKDLQKLSSEKTDLIKQVSELTTKNQEFLPSWYINLRVSFLEVVKMISRLGRRSI